MSVRESFDFNPSLERSPCFDCPKLIRELGHKVISQGLALVEITELCPPYREVSGLCIVDAMELNTMVADQVDYFSE